jgi:hypothetical protein
LNLEDDAYAKFLGECGSFSHDTALFVDADTHLFAVGFPEKDTTAAGCSLKGRMALELL